MDERYTIALVKQIVASGSDDVLGRVVNALFPGAEINENTKREAKNVLSRMFEEGEIVCPRCGAVDDFESQLKCTEDSFCPVEPLSSV